MLLFMSMFTKFLTIQKWAFRQNLRSTGFIFAAMTHRVRRQGNLVGDLDAP